MDNFAECLKFTLLQEGGWSNNPNDPGGATMKGVTLAVYRQWKHNPNLTGNDLKKITDGELQAIYSQNYWVPSAGDKLPLGVDLMVFDMSVNAGVSRSAKLLQATVGANIDGAIGTNTLSKIAALNPVAIINALAEHQAAFYKSLSTFKVFGKGWMNRINARHAASLALAAKNPANVHPSTPVAKPVSEEDHPPVDFFSWLKSLV